MSNLLPQQPEPEREAAYADPTPEVLSYPARSADLGADFTVTRILPQRQHRIVGPWCFFDTFGPLSFASRKAMDVAPHPHIGLQTVSWLFDGEVLHNDSLGCQALARPGELNLMTAGRGITHSEETPSDNSGHLHGLQLWVALPESARHRAPQFDHYRDLPALEPGGGEARIFMGELAGVDSGTRAFSPLVAADLKVIGKTRLRLPLNAAWEYALVVVDGDLGLDGVRLSPGMLHYLGMQRDGLELVSQTGGHAVLIGGLPFGEAIVIWWNFVARTVEDIRHARDDWQAGRHFGEVNAYHGKRLQAPPLVGRPIPSR